MSWDRTCCISTTSSSTGSTSSSTYSPSSLTHDYDIPPPPPPSSSFFCFSSSDYIEEREENKSLPPPPPPQSSIVNNHHSNYSRDTCLCNPSYDISSSFQSPFIYEQYLTSLKSEQSEHLPYLFDNIIYPQPCSPPSPINDSITYYQLDQANTTTIINKYPQRSHHIQTIQPIIYQQLSVIEPPSSNIQQKLPIIKRFYYDSNMSNTTTTTIITTTPIMTNGNEQIHVPYARLESSYFGTYDIWQEKTLIGRKNHRCEVDINIGSTSVVSRIHLELLLINGIEFHLKCRSKNGIFINNNYTNMSSTTILPKQCTLRFPSTDLCISFSSLLNNNLINRSSPSEHFSQHLSIDTSQRRLLSSSTTIDRTFQSVPNLTSQQQQQQQVILVGVNQQTQTKLNNNLQPLSINIPNSSSSPSSLSTSSDNEQMKSQHDSPQPITNHSFLGSSISSCSINLKIEPNENPLIVNSPISSRILSNENEHNIQEQDHQNSKNDTKPPFSYAQLIVQAILSAPDKQMTLSQIYHFISVQYPYYQSNNRGWQNSIRHNLSLNRYFIRLARKENESGKGSFWRLDPTCEEKLIDHAFRHRKQRRNSNHNISSINSNTKNESEEIHSPMIQYSTDPTDFFLTDIHTSNSCTPLSPMTSPITLNVNFKRKQIDNEIEEILNQIIDSILNDQTIKRQKI